MSNRFFRTSQGAVKCFEHIEREFAKAKEHIKTCKDPQKYIADFLGNIGNPRAQLLFSPKAWIMMTTLIKDFSTEVQWHGLTTRLSNNTFLVEDILIFPHEVTGTTVISDQEEYEEWQNSLDDETFNKIRFHGHSHVNMGVTPSGVDNGYRNGIINSFPTPTDKDDFYYIFLIGNKRDDFEIEIYDITNGVHYKKADVDMDIFLEDGYYMSHFKAESKLLAKDKPIVMPPKTSTSVNQPGKPINTAPKQTSGNLDAKNPDTITSPPAKTTADKGGSECKHAKWDEDDDAWLEDYYKRYGKV